MSLVGPWWSQKKVNEKDQLPLVPNVGHENPHKAWESWKKLQTWSRMWLPGGCDLSGRLSSYCVQNCTPLEGPVLQTSTEWPELGQWGEVGTVRSWFCCCLRVWRGQSQHQHHVIRIAAWQLSWPFKICLMWSEKCNRGAKSQIQTKKTSKQVQYS